MRKTLLFFGFAGVLLLSGCATKKQVAKIPTKAETYQAMYEENPVTVLIMPPINRTEHVAAKDIFHSTLSMPICNAGYYVIPPFLSMEILKQESAYDAELFLDTPLTKFGEVFGADLALFTIIHTWKKTVGKINVEIEYIAKSIKSNEIVYQRKGDIKLNPNISLPGSIDPISLLTAAVLTAASTIQNATTDNTFVGIICNNIMLSDLPAGPYSPSSGNDGDLSAATKEYNAAFSGKAKNIIAGTNQRYLSYTFERKKPDNNVIKQDVNNTLQITDKTSEGQSGEVFNLDGIELIYVRGKESVNDFYIGRYEVTQAQWKAITGKNPSKNKGDVMPVENVSWDDVQKYIINLNKKTGKHYRLPTEAEWEYAARGGNDSRNYSYSGSNNLSDVAWFGSGSPHAVGLKSPNELGIYDMSGNVWEWCADTHGKTRVLRGGASNQNESNCLIISRYNGYDSSYRSDNIGFRLVLNP